MNLNFETFTLARLDRARYLCALTVPRRHRSHVLALLAFDQEIARIPKLVSEPMLGKIRLQWWIDELPALAKGSPLAHPVAQDLAGIDLPTESLQGLIEARNFDLNLEPFTFDDLCRYAEDSGGAFQALVLEKLGVDDEQAVLAAREIGAAKTMAGFLNTADIDEKARTYIQDNLNSARGRVISRKAKKMARPAFLLARLVDREMRLGGAANDMLGAVFSVWWGKKSGRY